ncbi:aminotransferase class III-fold pyridoxal phosphate-dependent enzyme [Kocuria sp. SM24M-10]|uniref:aminotransferase class III-fold pyridoxal phosphate-dependent enzyme n=1 Tax=Kocuria sp. SM24M-10 TaxID=1660349 RepID=UPI00064AF9D0|nr:aminotransferase class III-fold pyridoxal phosphate-dependent enzyme [Kocuria sp. SM24M-10]KLU10713.1 hypothetical protein ABL57_05485 [Kocuria sp. SM24M-10]
MLSAALGALETIEEWDLIARARRIEEIIREELTPVAEETGIVGEIRGRGGMMALEFVLPGGKEPDADAAKAIAAECLAQGVIILTCGTFGNIVRLLPPLVIGEDLLRDGPSCSSPVGTGCGQPEQRSCRARASRATLSMDRSPCRYSSTAWRTEAICPESSGGAVAARSSTSASSPAGSSCSRSGAVRAASSTRAQVSSTVLTEARSEAPPEARADALPEADGAGAPGSASRSKREQPVRARSRADAAAARAAAERGGREVGTGALLCGSGTAVAVRAPSPY